MALSNGSFNTGPLIFLNARSKDAEGNLVKPHFEIAKAGDDKKVVKTGDSCTEVTGDLMRPRFTTREWKGDQVRHIVLYIKGKNAEDPTVSETYSLDNTYRISTRALFNAILSLNSLEETRNLKISIYENKKGYEALTLNDAAGKMVPWKYDGRKGEIPEALKVTFKGKQQSDFTPTDDFFEAKLKEWSDRIFGVGKGEAVAVSARTDSAPKAAANTQGTATSKTNDEIADGDLPF